LRPLTLYFHGLPGSAAELAAFGPQVAAKAEHFHVVARANPLANGPDGGYFDRLADHVATQFPKGPLRLVGFSLGAAAALRAAPRLGERVEQIDLVSPAGPLGLGDFLDDMAGAPVFRAATAGRLPFAALTLVQAQLARFAPRKLADTLMAKAKGADRDLATDPQFLAKLALSLRTSLLDQRAAYSAEILAYVADWAPGLADVQPPVAIWQGSEDDWTPPAMAHCLVGALPGEPQVTMLSGMSHFSALRAYLEA
jgi:pimeloyl-ACP methyl ester carboxylesterase